MEINIVGNKIRSLLESNNMTQTELANKIGMSSSTIARYISGIRVPSKTALTKIANVLDVTTDFLLGKESVMKDYNEVKRLIERSKNSLSYEDRLELIKLLAE